LSIETSATQDLYLRRCIELALRGGTQTTLNPMVGAVVVYQNQILGEGWHQQFGGNHAEVNAIHAVQDQSLLPHATLYVNLEPCNIHGKTPPCTDLILRSGIPAVIIGCTDPNPLISGKGIKMMMDHGINVTMATDPRPFIDLNKIFFINQRYKRPYIVLKWAETANGFIGSKKGQRLIISGRDALRYVHYLRSRYHAIMIGKNTALRDDPYLNLRHYYGQNPTRIVLDIDHALTSDKNVFRSSGNVLIINKDRNETNGHVKWFAPDNPEAFLNVNVLMQELYARAGVASILVEGGRFLLQQFINQGIYDELIVIRSDKIIPEADISAPLLMNNFKFDRIIPLGSDTIFFKFNHNLYDL
jgi:diaminohydroxyphosphoribosylaminopyrimidine deaminase/5-amino-6-(5-phosphoribosylamino)uracil reductase